MKDTIDTTPTVNDESFWKKNVKEVPADQVRWKPNYHALFKYTLTNALSIAILP
jgi:hypothetical protein